MDDDFGISTIEELEPENRPRRASASIKWELLLGLALIIGVLGWAGFQWLQQEDAKNHYQSGEKAEATYNWDVALSEFRLAQDANFRDARIRADNAASEIVDRDKLYQTAKDQISNGQWIEAMRSLDALKAIQPNYKDSAAIATNARKIIFREALSGSLSSRPNASPPGLYYGSPDGWVWLQGSDRWSAVQGFDQNVSSTPGSLGHVIFDVPKLGWNVPSGADSASGSGGLPDLTGRRLVVATLGSGKPTYQPLTFDPNQYNFYVSGARGVWAIRSDYTLPAPIAALPFAPYSRDDLAYEAIGSVLTTSVQFPSQNSTVLALDPTGNRMLFAEWDTPSPSDRADLPGLRVYLATATGRILRMVYSFSGGLATTQISPDGNYALLRTYAPVGSKLLPQKQEVVLLNLQHYSLPRVLTTAISNDTDIASSAWSPTGGATFITRGKLAGLVLTVDWSGGKNVVRLIDPSKQEGPMLEVTVDEPVHFLWASSLDDQLTLLLGGVNNFDGQSFSYSHTISNSVTMAAVSLGATLSTRIAHFATDGSVAIRAMSNKGDNMLYELEDLENLASSSHRILYSMSSLPLASLGTREAGLTHIYSQITNLSAGADSESRLEPNWYPGPGLLSYVKDGTAHARSYSDPTVDVPLETTGTVTSLFDWTVTGAMDLVR